MRLQGGPELRARLRAIKVMFKPYGRDWADDAAQLMRSTAPVKTGHLQRSIRRRNATQRKATVWGDYWAVFANRGTKAYTIAASPGRPTARRLGSRLLKFEAGGRTIFSKQVHKPRRPARPFVDRAAAEALRRHPMAAALIDRWNEAAR